MLLRQNSPLIICFDNAAPSSALDRSMLFTQPFASATQPQPRAVDDQMQLAGILAWQARDRQSASPAAQGRMVRYGQFDAQDGHDRPDQALSLAQTKPKYTPQGQRGFDGHRGISGLPAAPR